MYSVEDVMFYEEYIRDFKKNGNAKVSSFNR